MWTHMLSAEDLSAWWLELGARFHAQSVTSAWGRLHQCWDALGGAPRASAGGEEGAPPRLGSATPSSSPSSSPSLAGTASRGGRGGAGGVGAAALPAASVASAATLCPASAAFGAAAVAE
jgi:hypothetical protein